MSKGMLFLSGLLFAFGFLFAGCSECLEQGSNGVPDPGLDEFQLQFNNIVNRETEIFVDGQLVGTVCLETEYATVGNFPVSTETEIMYRLLLSGTDCYHTPNCDGVCDAQTCWGPPILDSTPFAGRVLVIGIIWDE